MTATASYDFDSDTQVEPTADHEYAVAVSERWNILTGVANGGYLLALCLQALRRDMPYPDPLVASAYFLRPGVPGPARVTTELIRHGRRMATGQARLNQDGDEVVRVLASFADHDRADGHTELRNGMPELPDPASCVNPLEGISFPGPTIADRVEIRYPQPPGWMRGQPGNQPHADFWLRFADGRPADPISLALLVDAAAPVVLDLGVAGSSTVELTVHPRGRPAPGWLACRVSTRHIIDGYHEEDFEIWDSAGHLVAQSRQLALLPPQDPR